MTFHVPEHAYRGLAVSSFARLQCHESKTPCIQVHTLPAVPAQHMPCVMSKSSGRLPTEHSHKADICEFLNTRCFLFAFLAWKILQRCLLARYIIIVRENNDFEKSRLFTGTILAVKGRPSPHPSSAWLCLQHVLGGSVSWGY